MTGGSMADGRMTGLREATPDELVDWDAHTVDMPGGDVYQSVAWGRHRERQGWRPRFIVFEDGFRLLSLERRWPLIGGGGAYISRGPVAAGEPVERTAERLRAATDWLVAHGIDAVSADAEIEVSTGYAALIEARGFRQIEEIQPSRHRVALRLPPGTTEGSAFMATASSVRQRVRHAEKAGFRVVRWDRRVGGGVGPGFEAPPSDADDRAAFDRFYDLLVSTAARRHFGLRPRAGFVDWSSSALAAGHVVFLQVLDAGGEVLGAATFYRHGGRLTYSHSGDRADVRREHPGVIHLLLWRAIQLAIRDGLIEVDLAGVDVPGLRREPRDGDATYGLYAFKRSFGADWLELVGNHEFVARPMRYFLGRATGRLASRLHGDRS
jgi:lipid II:glycine glycyltransferase (peptidoglycan interpeptide bridge formation enzyme)